MRLLLDQGEIGVRDLFSHRKLDQAVDAAYTRKKFTGDADRVAFLFEQYQKITSLLPAGKRGRARRKG